MDTWVIVGHEGLCYVGLHPDEEDAWRVYLGWPTKEDIAVGKSNGYYAAKATLTWQKPTGQ